MPSLPLVQGKGTIPSSPTGGSRLGANVELHFVPGKKINGKNFCLIRVNMQDISSYSVNNLPCSARLWRVAILVITPACRPCHGVRIQLGSVSMWGDKRKNFSAYCQLTGNIFLVILCPIFLLSAPFESLAGTSSLHVSVAGCQCSWLPSVPGYPPGP